MVDSDLPCYTHRLRCLLSKTGKEVPIETITKNNTKYVSFLLYETGSMQEIKRNTMEGFNGDRGLELGGRSLSHHHYVVIVTCNALHVGELLTHTIFESVNRLVEEVG